MLEIAAIIEPSRSLNELIRLSSVHPQSEKIDAIIRHHEMLQSLELACTLACCCCCAGNTCSSDRPMHHPLHTSPSSVRSSIFPSTSPVLYGRHDKFQSSLHEKSIPCQLRGPAGDSCDWADVTLSPNVNGVKADAATVTHWRLLWIATLHKLAGFWWQHWIVLILLHPPNFMESRLSCRSAK